MRGGGARREDRDGKERLAIGQGGRPGCEEWRRRGVAPDPQFMADTFSWRGSNGTGWTRAARGVTLAF